MIRPRLPCSATIYASTPPPARPHIPKHTHRPARIQNMPSIVTTHQLPSASKEAHLAAIRRIEREEEQIRREIEKQRAERKVLEKILTGPHMPKENGTAR